MCFFFTELIFIFSGKSETFEFEKGQNIAKVEQMKLLETDLVAKATEVERLRTEMLNAERRAQGIKFMLVFNPIFFSLSLITLYSQAMLPTQQSTRMVSLTCTQLLLQYTLAQLIWMAMEDLTHKSPEKGRFPMAPLELLPLDLELEARPPFQIPPGDKDLIKLRVLGSKLHCLQL